MNIIQNIIATMGRYLKLARLLFLTVMLNSCFNPLAPFKPSYINFLGQPSEGAEENNVPEDDSDIQIDLTSVSNQVITDGQAIAAIDINNKETASDFDQEGAPLYYFCKYDQVIDGIVASPTNCSDIAGLSWNESKAQITWTPNNQVGTYEFKIIAYSANQKSSEVIFSITVNAPNCFWEGETEFISAPTNNSCYQQLASNDIVDVFVSDGVIYAATGGGLSISTDGGASFINRTTAQGLGSNSVLGVYADGGTLYAATGGGLSVAFP